jgi:hypothetical protein
MDIGRDTRSARNEQLRRIYVLAAVQILQQHEHPEYSYLHAVIANCAITMIGAFLSLLVLH